MSSTTNVGFRIVTVVHYVCRQIEDEIEKRSIHSYLLNFNHIQSGPQVLPQALCRSQFKSASNRLCQDTNILTEVLRESSLGEIVRILK